MLDTPRITTTIAQTAAVVHLTIPRDQIQRAMGPAIGEVMAALGVQGIAPAGPLFSHHRRMDPAIFDFEIGVSVSAAVQPVGRVVPATLPAATVARTIYRGPYEGLGQAWGEFQQWVRDHGHTAAPNLWECYAVGPESSDDSSTWQTELSQPLLR